MAGGGGLDVIGNLRGLTGLDRLSFAGGGDGDGVEVSGGKYLTENVLLIVTGDIITRKGVIYLPNTTRGIFLSSELPACY